MVNRSATRPRWRVSQRQDGGNRCLGDRVARVGSAGLAAASALPYAACPLKSSGCRYLFSVPPCQGGIEGGLPRTKDLPQPLLIKEGSYPLRGKCSAALRGRRTRPTGGSPASVVLKGHEREGGFHSPPPTVVHEYRRVRLALPRVRADDIATSPHSSRRETKKRTGLWRIPSWPKMLLPEMIENARFLLLLACASPSVFLQRFVDVSFQGSGWRSTHRRIWKKGASRSPLRRLLEVGPLPRTTQTVRSN